MAQPYVGEIRMFAGNFAPAGWMFCEGQLLPISENETLFQLIGTTYGGDGQSTFALPDLRGRLPVHMGSGFILGETGGTEEITLTVNQIPAHGHPWLGSADPASPEHHSTASWGERRQMPTRASLHRRCSLPSACHRSVEANRTPTSSLTCVSTSSFPCSGFSRHPPRRKRWPILLSQKSESFPSTSLPGAGPGAMAS